MLVNYSINFSNFASGLLAVIILSSSFGVSLILKCYLKLADRYKDDYDYDNYDNFNNNSNHHNNNSNSSNHNHNLNVRNSTSSNNIPLTMSLSYFLNSAHTNNNINNHQRTD